MAAKVGSILEHPVQMINRKENEYFLTLKTGTYLRLL